MSEGMNADDYLKGLDKWTATSHPELADRKPEELFEAAFVERYQRLHKDLWCRIIRVHGTLYTLEQLDDFPFDHLYAPDGMEFWRLVAENFLDVACIMLHGLVNDDGTDAYTIRRFRNDTMAGPWRDENKHKLLPRTLREREFDTVADSIAERVREIRNGRVAHQLVDRQTGHLKGQMAGVSLTELRKLFDTTHAMFGALSFGPSYVTLAGDLAPSTVGGEPTRTCLHDLLDAVLRDSYFVNKPELKHEWWADLRKHMDPERLRVMNQCRKRVGLAEA